MQNVLIIFVLTWSYWVDSNTAGLDHEQQQFPKLTGVEIAWCLNK